jgi:GLPGLI family protein
MMKNILFILFYFTYVVNGFAQKSCKIIYTIEATADIFEKEDPDMHGYDKKINEAVKTHASNFSFLLKIHGNESYFEPIKTMSSDNDNLSYKLASAILQSRLKYYLNTSSNQKLTEVEAYGKKYIILDSLNDWKITKEQRIIGDYTCYKATTKKMVENSKGTFNTEIIAWFTTELPYSFGPIGYGGLPGLILELEDRVIKYRLKKIDFVKSVKISRPEEGEFVTHKELLEVGERTAKNKDR